MKIEILRAISDSVLDTSKISELIQEINPKFKEFENKMSEILK